MPTTRTEQITAPDGGTFDGYLALPDSGSGPGIVLIQEIFGVGEYIKKRANDLAALGYVVLAPDVFWRVERNVALDHDEEGLGKAFGYMERYGAIDQGTSGADLGAVLAHLRGLPEVQGKAAVMGFCLGGRLAYEMAVALDPDACVSYYGSGIADRLDDADNVTCPAIFHFGGADPYIPLEQAEAVAKAFAARDDVEVHVADGAGHAFDNSSAPMFFDAGAAERAWQQTTDFLARTLRG